MPNWMYAETRDDRDFLNCLNAVNPGCRRRDRPNPVLDDEADADRGDNRRNCATALEAGKDHQREEDPHKGQERAREDRSPNEAAPIAGEAPESPLRSPTQKGLPWLYLTREERGENH